MIIDISKSCGENFIPPDLLEEDRLGCPRGVWNALLIQAVICAVLFAAAWLVKWLQH